MSAPALRAAGDIGRHEIDQLAEAGHLNARQRDAALRVAGVVPGAADWSTFLSRLFLFSGAALLVVAIGYFVAYNWDGIGRFTKIALLEIAVMVAAFAAALTAPGELKSRAALLAAVLTTGTLLAFVGQTYQTGADTYELFLAWALLTLPWVGIARWRPLVCVWIVIANVSMALYVGEVWRPLFGTVFDSTALISILLANAGLLVLLEFGWVAARLDGGGRSAERLLIALVLVSALLLFIFFLFDSRVRTIWSALVPVLAGGAIWFAYRRQKLDLVALAMWCFAAIAAAVSLVAKLIVETKADAFGFLLAGAVAIGLSAWAAQWLRGLARAPCEHDSGTHEQNSEVA